MKKLAVIAPLLAVVAFAPPVHAGAACKDLWFTRNLVMDRAGHCFKSALGKALFDNKGCKAKSVKLSKKAQKLIAKIRAQEKTYGCKVDTSKTSLDLDDMAMRRKLIDMPIAVEEESGCIGWKEPETPLYVARNKTSDKVGKVIPGDNVLYNHWDSDSKKWSYIWAVDAKTGAFKSAGWLNTPSGEPKCEMYAG